MAHEGEKPTPIRLYRGAFPTPWPRGRLRLALSATSWMLAGYPGTMSSVPIDIPEATLVALKLDAADAAAQLRMAAAIKLFELGRSSSGAAAELAGVPRVAFLAKLGEFGVKTFRQTEMDIANDLANA